MKVKVNYGTILVSFFLKTPCYILEDESGIELLLVIDVFVIRKIRVAPLRFCGFMLFSMFKEAKNKISL